MSLAAGTAFDQARARRLQASIPAIYTFFKEGATYYAEAMAPGGTDYSGTNGRTVLNLALASLSAGRTWKEAVYLKGDLTITGTVAVPSYTRLVLDGRVTLGGTTNLEATGGQYFWFHNSDPTGGNTEIEFVGGIYDGNSQGSNVYGINLRKCTDSVVDGVRVEDTTETAIALEYTCQRCWVQGCTVVNGGYDGIGTGGFGSINSDIWFLYNHVSGSTPHNAIVAEQECTRIFVIGNEVTGATENGIHLQSRNSVIAENICYGNGHSGIAVHEQNSKAVFNVVVDSNHSFENTRHGIYVLADHDGYVYRIVVSDNQVWDNAYGGGSYSGIVTEAQGIHIHGNLAFDTRAGGAKTQEYGIAIKGDIVSATNCFVYDNNVRDNLLGGIALIGTYTGSQVKNNPGYVNEAKGVATIASGNNSVDIDPGFDASIDFTASEPIVVVSGQHAEVRDLTWAVKDADEITVTASGATTGDRKINYAIWDVLAI